MDQVKTHRWGARVLVPALLLNVLIALGVHPSSAGQTIVQFVFTSDAHYGISRDAFRGLSSVNARIVNQALVAKINTLAGVTLPHDGGVEAGHAVGPIDFVAEGGDIANREEGSGAEAIQSAAASWAQFRADYVDGLTARDRMGRRAPVFVVPGNHDASNAVGFYRPMTPPVDKTAMVEMFNRMVRPSIPRSTLTYDYERDPVLFSRDVGGVHFEFLEIWPDSRARKWMESDLSRIAAVTPVIVITHDEPAVEAKHFKNPNGAHDVNDRDRFENLLADELADGATIEAPTSIEQAAFEQFLARHPNIVAYFHGNSNWNQFYKWTGPFQRVVLNTFRVDSPIRGAESRDDETRLSFHVATIDTRARKMTVRECLWNSEPNDPSSAVAWGASSTIDLTPAPTTH
jgi:hypothetical protein